MCVKIPSRSLDVKIRIGTFNAENLFARFKFRADYTKEELTNVVKEGWAADKTKFVGLTGDDRRITASAIKAIKADILGLQEIEAMDTLKRFVKEFLPKEGFNYQVLIDGNDPRLIDVALLSKFPIDYIRTHQFDRLPGKKGFIFSRDCLEVGVRLSQGTVLPVFVNHFKSMVGGRKNTMPRRKAQAQRVVEILQSRFGDDPGESAWVVLGDLNDYMPSEGLQPLLGQPWMENVLDRLPEQEQWTHHYSKKDEYKQLDYILLSRSLATANPGAVPEVERRGLPQRAKRYTGKRFPRVGKDRPKASDHCPVLIELEV